MSELPSTAFGGGGGSSATPEMSPPLFLLPEPETLQLTDSQSGLGAAAD